MPQNNCVFKRQNEAEKIFPCSKRLSGSTREPCLLAVLLPVDRMPILYLPSMLHYPLLPYFLHTMHNSIFSNWFLEKGCEVYAGKHGIYFQWIARATHIWMKIIQQSSLSSAAWCVKQNEMAKIGKVISQLSGGFRVFWEIGCEQLYWLPAGHICNYTGHLLWKTTGRFYHSEELVKARQNLVSPDYLSLSGGQSALPLFWILQLSLKVESS